MWYCWMCLVLCGLISKALGSECQLEVGDGKVEITVSSSINDEYNSTHGRQYTIAGNKDGEAWNPGKSSGNEWIQVDIGEKKCVTGVLTQGDSEDDVYVTLFKVNQSTDGTLFEPVLNETGEVEFIGNTDKDTEVKNMFNTTIHTRFIRIIIMEHNGFSSGGLRFVLLGRCADNTTTLNHPPGTIVDTDMSTIKESVDFSSKITGKSWDDVFTITRTPDPTATSPPNTAVASSENTDTRTPTISDQASRSQYIPTGAICTGNESEQRPSVTTDENSKTESSVMEYFIEFEDRVFSNLNHMKCLQNKTEYFYRGNYIGIAKIENTNSINTLMDSEKRVEFSLEVQEIKDDVVLIVAAYYENKIETNEILYDSVAIAGLDNANVVYRYLTGIFMCNVYDIVNISRLKAKLNFSIFQKMDTLYTESELVVKEPICLFLNETQLTWSDEGVMLTDHSQDKVSCYSDHITSFSVLMKVTKAEDNKILSLMSKVCVSMSLFALVVSLVIYCSFPELWKSLRVSIHKNLVINMILMQSLFIFGIEKTGHKIICGVVTVLLHLTALNTFSWMFGEAVYLHFKVSTSAPSQHNRLRNYMAVCYGIPLIIVVISSAGFASEYQHENMCWISQKSGMIWAFVAPAFCIAMVNTGIMLIVLKTIYNRAGNMVGKPAATRNKFKQLRKTTRGTFMLLPIMGSSWIIGPFAVNSDTEFLDYVFIFLNGCQGIFILLIYCIFDNEINECFNKRFKKNEVTSQTEMTQNTRTHEYNA